MAYIVHHYLDACILAKAVLQEPGHSEVAAYLTKEPGFFFSITPFAFYEALGVLKRKWNQKKLSEAEYYLCVSRLAEFIEQELISIDADCDIPNRALLSTARDLVGKYQIDYSDAMQLLSVIHGKHRRNAYESKTVFVSEDDTLVKAARNEGLRTWHFGKEPAPTGA